MLTPYYIGKSHSRALPRLKKLLSTTIHLAVCYQAYSVLPPGKGGWGGTEKTVKNAFAKPLDDQNFVMVPNRIKLKS